jgi:hypothetical protein
VTTDDSRNSGGGLGMPSSPPSKPLNAPLKEGRSQSSQSSKPRETGLNERRQTSRASVTRRIVTRSELVESENIAGLEAATDTGSSSPYYRSGQCKQDLGFWKKGREREMKERRPRTVRFGSRPPPPADGSAEHQAAGRRRFPSLRPEQKSLKKGGRMMKERKEVPSSACRASLLQL